MEVTMKYFKAALILTVLIAPFLFVSCDLTPMTNAEFAQWLMKTSADKGYIDGSSKVAGELVYEENGLSIWLWSTGGSVSFTNFEFMGSVVNGNLSISNLTVLFSGDNPTSLEMTFNGTLTVTGKYAGTYEFVDAVLSYDFTINVYSYGGTINIT
jgi:hypothetical protein